MKFVDGYCYEIDDDVLSCLKTHTGRKNKAEVIRDALAIYKFILDRTLMGQRFYVGTDRAQSTACDFSPLRKIVIGQAVAAGTEPTKHPHSK